MRPRSDCRHAENERAWVLARPLPFVTHGLFRRSEAAFVRIVVAKRRLLEFPSQQMPLPVERRPVDRLERAIEESRGILDLHDDWDGDGSPGYDEPTWRQAVTILRRLSREARHLPVPSIAPAEAGSVDLYWGKPGHNLLLNVPEDTDAPVAYYGTSGRGKFSGVLDLEEDVSYLATWILKLPA